MTGPRTVWGQTRGVSASLADALIDVYVRWREECIAVHDAYERWIGAHRDDRPAAYAAYSAALDREERAGQVYADLVRRATPPAADPT